MVINIKHKKDLITLDLRCRQMRYLKDVADRGEIKFMDLSNGDVEGYEYLFKENLRVFKKCIREDLGSWGIRTTIKNMEILKNE